MIIQQKKSPSLVTFSTLEEGNTFRTTNHRDILWMRIQNVITEFDCYNAVDLSDGCVESFDDSELVTPVKVTAVEE